LRSLASTPWRRTSAEMHMALHDLGLASDTLPALSDSSAPYSRTSLNKRVDEALEGLWMALQPIVWGSPDRVHAHEALVRSETPGLRRPLELIAAAHQVGRARDLARAIRRCTADTLAGLPGHTRLFVNIDRADLEDPELYDARNPLAPFAPRVVLEVTEGTPLDEIAALNHRIERLRDVGFLLAVDDLDAGDTSLDKIDLLDADYVKLDVSLIRHVHQHRLRKELVRSMAYVCADMGRRLVAEGVEHEAERETLLENGCDLLQGYLFGRPTREPHADVVESAADY